MNQNILKIFEKKQKNWNKKDAEFKKYNLPVFAIVLNKNNKKIFIGDSKAIKRKNRICAAILRHKISENKIENIEEYKRKLQEKQTIIAKYHVDQMIIKEIGKNKKWKNIKIIINIPPCPICAKELLNKKEKYYEKIDKIIYLIKGGQEFDIENWKKINENQTFCNLEYYKYSEFYNKDYDDNILEFMEREFKKFRNKKRFKNEIKEWNLNNNKN